MASKWLVKSEPDTYAYADLERDGRTVWDGVRNHAAAGHLKAMKTGDQVFFYHSQQGKDVVAIAQVAKEAFPDAELTPVRRLKSPVALADMKANPALADMAMLRQGRLSVSPVTDAQWAAILKMAGE
jgi:predicted RNA-binding protein with PUA-like domain